MSQNNCVLKDIFHLFNLYGDFGFWKEAAQGLKGQEKYEQSGDEVGRNNVKAYLNEKTKAVGKL